MRVSKAANAASIDGAKAKKNIQKKNKRVTMKMAAGRAFQEMAG